MERGRPLVQGVPLIKYDFFDKLRADIISPSFSVKKIVTELKDGQWPFLQIIRTQGNSIYFFALNHRY